MEKFLPFLLVACGLFSIVCAYNDFDWFMNHRKASFMINVLGRKGARIFYAVLGLVICCAGIALFVTGTAVM